MIELLALALLILRVVATGILVRVLRAQWSLMQRPIDREAIAIIDEQDIIKYRKQLFYLTLLLAGSNLLPILFDIFILFDDLIFVWFALTLTEFLIIYTISNTLSAVLAAFLIMKIYANALKVDQTHESSDHMLMNDE